MSLGLTNCEENTLLCEVLWRELRPENGAKVWMILKMGQVLIPLGSFSLRHQTSVKSGVLGRMDSKSESCPPRTLCVLTIPSLIYFALISLLPTPTLECDKQAGAYQESWRLLILTWDLLASCHKAGFNLISKPWRRWALGSCPFNGV